MRIFFLLSPLSGEVDLGCNKVTGARMYHYSWTLFPVVNDQWETDHIGKCKKIIRGLQRGKEYAFRIAAVDGTGDSVKIEVR